MEVETQILNARELGYLQQRERDSQRSSGLAAEPQVGVTDQWPVFSGH
jgi:hypothetical protein